MADGDIKLSVNLDSSSAKKSAQDLGNVIQRALSSSSPKVQSLGLQLSKVSDKADKVAQEMRKLENTKLPTQEFQALSKDIESTFNQLTKVEAELDKMKAKGAAIQPTAQYKDLQDQESWLSKRINTISEKKTLSDTDKTELAGLRQELQDVRGEMEALRDLEQAFEKSPAFKEKEAEAEGLRQKLEALNAESTRMQESGEATMSGTDTGRYADLEATQQNLSTQSGILRQKILEALGDTNRLKTAFTGLVTMAQKSFSAFGTAMSKIGQATKNLLAHHKTANFSFKKLLNLVLKYGLGVRSLFLLYRKLRQAIKEGMKSLGASFPEVQAQLDSLQNSFSFFKSSLVSAFQPIFSVVVPALTTLINYLSSAMNALANFFAALTGQGAYFKAVKGNNAAAKAIGGAGGAAKDAKKELAEYDKLLVVDKDDSGGGGGGGGGGAGASQWEKTATKTNDFIESLKKAWKDGDYEGLGRIISNKLSEMMEKIPWKKIYSKAKDWGKNLAKFLNGFINPRLFGNVGATIAHALMVALTFLDSFGETFDWTNFGDSIATGINKFFKTFRFSKLAHTFNTWALGLLKTISTAIRGIEWSNIAKNIADGIATIQAEDIMKGVGIVVTDIVNAIEDFFSVKETWANLGSKMAEGINGFFKGFSGKDLAEMLNSVKDAIFTAIKYLVSKIDWKEIGQDIADFLANLDIGTVVLAIGAFALASGTGPLLLNSLTTLLTTTVAGLGGVSVGTVAVSVIAAVAIGWKIGNRLYEMASGHEVEGGFKQQLTEIWNGLFGEDKIEFKLGDFIEFTFGEDTPWNNFFGKIGDKIYDFFHNETFKEKFKDIGKLLLDGLVEGVKVAIGGISASKLFKKFVDKVKEFFGIHSPSTVFANIGTQLISGLKKGMLSGIAGIKTWIQTNIIDKITGAFDSLKEKVSKIFTSLFGGSEDGEGTVIDVVTNITSNFLGGLTSLADFDSLKKKWDAFKIAFVDVMSNIKSKLKGAFSKIADVSSLKDKYVSLKNAWKNMSSNLKGKFEGIFSKVADLDDVKERFTNLYNSWKNKSSELKAKVGGQISKITDLDSWKSTFTNLYNAWKGKLATYTANLAGAISKITQLDTWEAKITAVHDAWESRSADFDAYFNQAKKTLDGYASSISTLAKNWVGKTIDYIVNFDIVSGDFKKWVQTNIIDKMNKLFSTVPVLNKLHIPAVAARGGILSRATNVIAGEAGTEAIVPLERNLGWLDKMAGMISQKLGDVGIPLIANGNILPANSEFMQAINNSVSQSVNNSDIVNVLNNILNRLDTMDSNNEPIVLQLDKKVISRAVWDETNKRYKQTGKNSLGYI